MSGFLLKLKLFAELFQNKFIDTSKASFIIGDKPKKEKIWRKKNEKKNSGNICNGAAALQCFYKHSC